MSLHCKNLTAGRENFDFEKTALRHMYGIFKSLLHFIFHLHGYGLNSVLKLYQRFRESATSVCPLQMKAESFS
jgi:hypothetical protein